MAGYSGTPLPQKLGIKDGHVVVALGGPDSVIALLDVPVRRRLPASADVVLMFATWRRDLERRLDSLRRWSGLKIVIRKELR